MRQLGIALLFLFCFTSISVAADKGIALSKKQGADKTSGKRRLALVIGNSAYRHSGALANPTRDAKLIAKTLKDVGFDLHGGGAQTDLTRNSLDQAIESFGDSIRPGDVALFYYSGHGLQVAGENYLVPVDANIKKESEVRVKTVPVNLLFAKLDGIPKAVNIVVLDACRNNPFARSFRSSGGGLASVSAPTGTLVAFSTSPGQVAEDGSGNNSTYSAALAKYVKEPGLSIEGVFKKVRSEVGAATGGQQTPWENTSLTGNFKFIDSAAMEAALAKSGQAMSAELERLLKMEAEAKAVKQREQAEMAKRQAALEKMDAEIVAMKERLGAGQTTENDSLSNMLVMVEQRETQAQKLEVLRRQRAEEERGREAEIARLKAKEERERRKVLEIEIAKYKKIVNSPYGKDLADAAWQGLIANYNGAHEVDTGDVGIFRQVAIEGVSVAEIRKRNRTHVFNGKLITMEQKSGYWVGFQVGYDFFRQGVTVDIDYFVQGLSDSMHEKTLKFTVDEMQEAFRQFQENSGVLENPEMQTKLGYAFGVSVSNDFVGTGMRLDPLVIGMGVRDGFGESRPKIPAVELGEIFEAYQRQLVEERDKKNKTYLKEYSSQKGAYSTSSGLRYRIIRAGTGRKPTENSRVEVHYKVELVDGTELFGNENEKIQINTIGTIGMYEALQLMKEGAKWELVIPPDLAYGERGLSPKIPSNAVLVINIELIKVI